MLLLIDLYEKAAVTARRKLAQKVSRLCFCFIYLFIFFHIIRGRENARSRFLTTPIYYIGVGKMRDHTFCLPLHIMIKMYVSDAKMYYEIAIMDHGFILQGCLFRT